MGGVTGVRACLQLTRTRTSQQTTDHHASHTQTRPGLQPQAGEGGGRWGTRNKMGNMKKLITTLICTYILYIDIDI